MKIKISRSIPVWIMILTFIMSIGSQATIGAQITTQKNSDVKSPNNNTGAFETSMLERPTFSAQGDIIISEFVTNMTDDGNGEEWIEIALTGIGVSKHPNSDRALNIKHYFINVDNTYCINITSDLLLYGSGDHQQAIITHGNAEWKYINESLGTTAPDDVLKDTGSRMELFWSSTSAIPLEILGYGLKGPVLAPGLEESCAAVPGLIPAESTDKSSRYIEVYDPVLLKMVILVAPGTMAITSDLTPGDVNNPTTIRKPFIYRPDVIINEVSIGIDPYVEIYNRKTPDLTNSRPNLVDLDNDGDQDLVILFKRNVTLSNDWETMEDVLVHYYENIGTTSIPIWQYRSGAIEGIERFFDGNSFFNASITFGELNGDGKLDAVVCEHQYTPRFIYNNGTASNPVFIERAKKISIPSFDNELAYFQSYSVAIGDIDENGKEDFVTGWVNGSLNFFEYDNSEKKYIDRSNVYNTISNYPASGRVYPNIADIEGDGDLDVILTDGITINCYLNDGSASFSAESAYVNDIVITGMTGITFADINGDGDADCVVGYENGTLVTFIRSGQTNTIDKDIVKADTLHQCNLTNWKIQASNGKTYTFPADAVISEDDYITIISTTALADLGLNKSSDYGMLFLYDDKNHLVDRIAWSMSFPGSKTLNRLSMSSWNSVAFDLEKNPTDIGYKFNIASAYLGVNNDPFSPTFEVDNIPYGYDSVTNRMFYFGPSKDKANPEFKIETAFESNFPLYRKPNSVKYLINITYLGESDVNITDLNARLYLDGVVMLIDPTHLDTSFSWNRDSDKEGIPELKMVFPDEFAGLNMTQLTDENFIDINNQVRNVTMKNAEGEEYTREEIIANVSLLYHKDFDFAVNSQIDGPQSLELEVIVPHNQTGVRYDPPNCPTLNLTIAGYEVLYGWTYDNLQKYLKTTSKFATLGTSYILEHPFEIKWASESDEGKKFTFQLEFTETAGENLYNLTDTYVDIMIPDGMTFDSLIITARNEFADKSIYIPGTEVVIGKSETKTYDAVITDIKDGKRIMLGTLTYNLTYIIDVSLVTSKVGEFKIYIMLVPGNAEIVNYKFTIRVYSWYNPWHYNNEETLLIWASIGLIATLSLPIYLIWAGKNTLIAKLEKAKKEYMWRKEREYEE